MSYTKTQWVNNTTPINDTNLNKIEQGIYDNSLVVDAVNNTVKPSESALANATEITEGQMTNVIGIADIEIKGQTSQDGTPTPSAPVDVNIVSGSNVINTSNKNLLKIKKLTPETTSGITFTPVYEGGLFKYINVNGTASETAVYLLQNGDINQVSTFPNKLQSGTYTISDSSGSTSNTIATYIRYTTDNSTYSTGNSGSAKTFTINQSCKYISYIRIQSGTNVSNLKFYPQLEKSSTATTYEPHQGKELSLDLGNIELCKIGNYQDYFYKSGSKWYLHKEINKTTINGSTDQTILYSNFLNALVYTNSNIANVSQSSLGNIKCNRAVEIARNTLTTNNGICLNDEANRILIKFDGVSSYNTEALAREYFANNPYEVIYKASTTTNIEITNTTLISQLEAIYNAPLYEQTNITQTNNDLSMILDITACKDNINGIKAFIRK